MLLSHCFAVAFALLCSIAIAMDARFGMEWTAAELEEARSVVARVSNAYNAGAGSSNNGAGDTRHDRIVKELQARFPSRTMRQVTDLYIDLAVEKVQAAAQPQDAGGAAIVHPTFDLANDNFGMPPEQAAAAVNNNDVEVGMVFGGAPMEEAVEQAPPPPAPVVVNGGDDEEVNQDNDDDDEFWSNYEHRQFLKGLRVYGRGDWRNISKYLVRSRTPAQVSSHAQNYFHMMEIAGGHHVADLLGAAAMDDDDHDHHPNNNNNLGGWQVHAIVGVSPGAAGNIAPAISSNAAMNSNVAPFWAPLLCNPEIEQRMMEMQAQAQQAWNDQQTKMAAAATPTEGAADK